MKAYSIVIAVALSSLIYCQSTQNRSQLGSTQQTEDVKEVEITLISNPKHCPPCVRFDPIYKELQKKYANDPKVKLIDHKNTAPFYDFDENGNRKAGFSPEWEAFRQKHEIKGVPVIRVRIKNKDGQHIGQKTLPSEENGFTVEKDFYQFTATDKIEKEYLENYIQNSLKGLNVNPTFATQQPQNLNPNPTFKADMLIIGSDSLQIIRDENGLPIKLKQGSYIFDPNKSSSFSLSNGSQIKSSENLEGFAFDHCIDGNCKTIHFPTGYSLYPDLTPKDSTNVENNTFTEVKIEFKLCGHVCEFKDEMAKLEDIVANKYEGLSYEKVKQALEELKKGSDEFKDVAIPDLKK